MSIKGFNVNGNEQQYDYEYLDNKPTIPSASTATPQMDGTAAAGSSNAFARGDHVHPSDATKADKANAAPVIYDSASGATASFTDGADNMPVKRLVVAINPVQAGSGDPAPDNVRPISGWTGANVVVSPTQDAADGTTYSLDWQTEAGTVYGGTVELVSGKLSKTQEILMLVGSTAEVWYDHPTLSNWFACQLGFSCQQTITENNFVANWLKPYYGSPANMPLGTFMYANDSLGRSRLVIRTDVANNIDGLKTYLSQNNFVATFTRIPLRPDIDITPVTVTTLLGDNNIWADTGNVAVTYPADTKLYIDKKIAAI